MGSRGGEARSGELLAEQVAYHRALAPDYEQTGIPDLPVDELVRGGDALVTELRQFRPTGDVLELACGPGTWTSVLLEHASTVTAIDAAPEMLELAVARTGSDRVQFVQADVFDWEPDRSYDVVFFGLWLSHVPLERFEDFWSLVDRALKRDGRVAFADDGYRTSQELIDGERSSIIRRQLRDGTGFRIVKVPHTAERLEKRLRHLGWNIHARPIGRPVFWGSRARDPSRVTAT